MNIISSLISQPALQPQQQNEMLILPVASRMTVGKVIKTPFWSRSIGNFALCVKDEVDA